MLCPENGANQARAISAPPANALWRGARAERRLAVLAAQFVDNEHRGALARCSGLVTSRQQAKRNQLRRLSSMLIAERRSTSMAAPS